MTARMVLAYVAMAALVLMLSDVSAARAATKFCDIYPARCQYSGNGVNYYYPLGYRMPGSTEGAAWGCAVTDGKVTARSWGYLSRAEAADGALTGCKQRNSGGTCRVVSCSPKVGTRDEAHAILHR
jgi:hypothetical protein